MKLTIVATLYQSLPYLREFHARASVAARDVAGEDYEIVLVNDASPDASLPAAVALAQEDSHVVVVDLSRNFGHHRAMMAGLDHALGDRIFLIDSDLEEDPAYLISFEAQMNETSCDVVYGVQDQRKGRWFERWSGNLFWKTIRVLTMLAIPANIVTARLMSRRYVNALLQHREREVFIAGLWLITGFDQRPQMVRKLNTSPTTYTLGRKLSLLINSVTSFSNAPLVGIFYFGLVVSLFASFYIAFLLINKLMYAYPLAGWTSVMASIWLLGGLIISFMGIIGIYISKIFSEVKQRPYHIIKAVHGRK